LVSRGRLAARAMAIPPGAIDRFWGRAHWAAIIKKSKTTVRRREILSLKGGETFKSVKEGETPGERRTKNGEALLTEGTRTRQGDQC